MSVSVWTTALFVVDVSVLSRVHPTKLTFAVTLFISIVYPPPEEWSIITFDTVVAVPPA
jgi:hypothetical protein